MTTAPDRPERDMTAPSTSTPSSPLSQRLDVLRGVGQARITQLARLGIETVGDLLLHLPRAYEDLSDVRSIGALRTGLLQTAQGEVVELEGRRLPDGRTVVSVVVSDGRDCLEGVWFNQPHTAGRFRYGQRVAFSGKPRRYRGHWQMNGPRVQVLDGEDSGDGSRVIPVYRLTEDLRAEVLRGLLRQAVHSYAVHVPDFLPEVLRLQRGLPGVARALHDAHFPEDLKRAQAAHRRFAYQELLVLQVALALRRREIRDQRRAPVLSATPAIDAHIRRLFPFRLTADQDRAVTEICRDLAGDRPMQRLLQADVGAGKTAVAVYSLLVAVAHKHQAALMAPTEVLARQHWRTLETYLANSRVRRLLLTGALTPRQRKESLALIRQGAVDLVVGTQALVQEDVAFARLGLVVVDEQHRFGVSQRARVRRLGAEPHYLVMTATPIPRTVALTVFGDLDISVIREAPPGRLPVSTRWMPPGQREQLYQRLRQALGEGRQGYVVCPLVAESEALDLKAAEAVYQELRAGPFATHRLGLLHGRMPEDEKDAVMEAFRAGRLQLLVCTPVVEVGVDVANATLMVVEHAERFGLSQLHQLRGRVSRGPVAGEYYLFAEPAGAEARERLRAVTRSADGFELAELDARLRGVGEFFGTKQHGRGELDLADLLHDRGLLALARKDAISLVASDAGLRLPEHCAIRQEVLARYGPTLALAEVG